MLRIEIEGHDAAHIRAQLQDLLRLYPSEMEDRFRQPVIDPKYAPFGSTTMAKLEAKAAAGVVTIATVAGTDDKPVARTLGETGDSFSTDLPPVIKVADLVEQQTAEADANLAAAVAAGAATAVPPKKETRGRPRGSRNQPKVVVSDWPLKDSKTAQPAVADNTGSDPAVEKETPAAGIVQSAGAETAAVADAPATQPALETAPSAADMRAALHSLTAKFGNDVGMQKAREVLAQVGARKVKDVAEEHHAKIIDLANAEIAKVA